MDKLFGILLTVWIGFFAGIVPVEAAVDFRAGVNRDTITIGDPIVFRMRLVRGANDVTTFEWGDGFPAPFELLQRKPVQTVTLDDGRIQETTDITMTIFQVGQFQVPSVGLRFVLANGDSGRVASREIPIVIQSVKGAGESDIRDVKPPVKIEAQIPLWAWITLVGIVLFIIALVWWLRVRKRPVPVALPPPPTDWLAELKKVGQLGLIEQGKYKTYYSLLSDIVRRCIEAKTTIRAVEETTYEIARDLRRDQVDESFVSKVETFLTQADMVKFAKFQPAPEAVSDVMPMVEDILKILIRSKAEPNLPSEKGVTS